MNEEKRDISNKTIAILFVVTLLVSFAGTFVVVKSINEGRMQGSGISSTNQFGEVSIEVMKRPIAESSVSLEIVNNK